MNKTLAWTFLAAAASMLLLGRVGSAGPDTLPPGLPHWAGCYYAQYDSGLKQLITVGADGTWSANDINDLGFPGGSRDAVIQGAWEQVGPFQAELAGLWFQYDETGLHTATLRVRCLSTFDKDLQSFTNSAAVDLYLPSQNPALEEPFLYNVASLSGSGWKVTSDG